MSDKIKILLVEDDYNLGFVVQDQLKSEGYDVVFASDGVEGLKKFNDNNIHMCIFDVMMPKKDGFTLAKDVRKMNTEVPILFLTAKNQAEDKVEGFKVGADDYLTKPFSTEEFLLRIKAILRRVNLLEGEAIQTTFELGAITFDAENYILKFASGAEDKKLTKKEAKILLLLVQNMNKVLPRDVVLNSVWGQDDYFVGRSLDVFITKLRKYLKVDESVKINNIHGVGFKLTLE